MKNLNRQQLRRLIESVLREDDDLEAMMGSMSSRSKRRGGGRSRRLSSRASDMHADAAVGGKEKPLPENDADAKKKAKEYYNAAVELHEKGLKGREKLRENAALDQLYRCSGGMAAAEAGEKPGAKTIRVTMPNEKYKDIKVQDILKMNEAVYQRQLRMLLSRVR